MPEIDSIITAEISVSAHGFSGLHEAVKYLSDYSLQLEMVRQVASLNNRKEAATKSLSCKNILIRFFLKKMSMLLTVKI